MSFQIKIDGKLPSSILNKAALEKANYVVANQAMADMDQFIPYKQGHLAGSAHISDNKQTIVYDEPYAKAQFYGMINGHPVVNYTRSEHPQATKRWDLKAKSLYMDKWLGKVSNSLLGGK